MKTYTQTRYSYSPKRAIVWREICGYLNERYVSPQARVLEIGCGYGDFIANIQAVERVAVEADSSLAPFLDKHSHVRIHYGDALAFLSELPANRFDVVFCSNYFEHFPMNQVRSQLDSIHEALSPSGRLLVLQPNYRYCAPMYFDDWTHQTVFSHISFSDLAEIHGFSIIANHGRFLPFSFKSRFPVSRTLVRWYLRSPIKPLAAQFLLVAGKGTSDGILRPS